MEFNVLYGFLGAVATVIGFLISIATFSRNRDKDVSANAAHQAVINAKLDTISSGVESMRIDLKAEQKERLLLSEKILKLEMKNESIINRIDKLEDKINEN